ncbi:undecaprenyl-phosphate glucose phosphotransferase [Vreelandella gomseomensis]|uniref:Undecaprenyl-phosphate glucose phosphotransferase n=1 Tax=Vreelandella gomseomensis TaxID=370766 RepID=A0ABU1GG79_9GAMM|nr:undecaprenyl-phosphate glucose phosphotransferase [Halomonas gomseomensis]MDR5876000.1 undecaprenyl-phosphate glucose phosphotransferase [Halomonas gomseomensis]
MAVYKRPQSSDWLRRAMHCFDASIALGVSLLTLWMMPDIVIDGHDYLFLILIGSLLLPAVGELIGLYQSWRGRSLYTMLGVYTLAWMVTILLLSLLLTLLQSVHLYSRLWMGTAALSVFFIGNMTRIGLYLYLRRMRASGHNLKRVLLIGHAANLALLEKNVTDTPHAGYVIVKHLVDSQDKRFLVNIRRLAQASIFQRDFDEVWLGYPLSEGERVRQLMALLAAVPAAVRYFPDLPDIRLLNHRIAQVAGLYSLELNYTPLNGPMRIVKNLEDRILGLVLFVLFLPVMTAIAITIRCKMGSPVLFKQERHGLDGKRFKIYKFRTMSLHQSATTEQAAHHDPRVTPLGAFLRRTSLDELPQLYNVLQGRMSLVGPRPHAMDHNDHYKNHIDIYMQRHRVKPGMTGWAQVNGLRGITDDVKLMRKRVEYDLYYIERWSLGFDLKILVMTLTRGFINTQP